ncbi:MAG: hypothetical protein JOY64_27470 [Alphaproteobacteria bacterium]|nr:hypothetical protein [Alphaproteobacteria bacterium]MBV8411397.1 hypothetical protein [Alphaproteobacteria bacterium]
MKKDRLALAAPLALTMALALSACGGGSSSEVGRAYCPAPLTVQDAQQLTHFKEGAGRDPRDIAFEAAITASGTTCELSRGQMTVNLIMRITATAGPSVEPGVTRVPYFVRVINAAGSVVQSQEFTADYKLSPSSPRGTSQEELLLHLPYSQLSDLGGYRIAIGLKPTREELDYTRRTRAGQ